MNKSQLITTIAVLSVGSAGLLSLGSSLAGERTVYGNPAKCLNGPTGCCMTRIAPVPNTGSAAETLAATAERFVTGCSACVL